MANARVLIADPRPGFRAWARGAVLAVGVDAEVADEVATSAALLDRLEGDDLDLVILSRAVLDSNDWRGQLSAVCKAAGDASVVLLTLFDDPAYQAPARAAGAAAVVSRQRWHVEIPRLLRQFAVADLLDESAPAAGERDR